MTLGWIWHHLGSTNLPNLLAPNKVLITCAQAVTWGRHLRAPATDEGDFVEQGGLDDLGQGLHHILHVNVADEQTQPEATLQLLDAMVHILRLQQVEPATCMHTYI